MKLSRHFCAFVLFGLGFLATESATSFNIVMPGMNEGQVESVTKLLASTLKVDQSKLKVTSRDFVYLKFDIKTKGKQGNLIPAIQRALWSLGIENPDVFVKSPTIPRRRLQEETTEIVAGVYVGEGESDAAEVKATVNDSGMGAALEEAFLEQGVEVEVPYVYPAENGTVLVVKVDTEDAEAMVDKIKDPSFQNDFENEVKKETGLVVDAGAFSVPEVMKPAPDCASVFEKDGCAELGCYADLRLFRKARIYDIRKSSWTKRGLDDKFERPEQVCFDFECKLLNKSRKACNSSGKCLAIKRDGKRKCIPIGEVTCADYSGSRHECDSTSGCWYNIQGKTCVTGDRPCQLYKNTDVCNRQSRCSWNKIFKCLEKSAVMHVPDLCAPLKLKSLCELAGCTWNGKNCV